MEIPGYTLERLIGSGGMATVYLALQESLQRQVALKLIRPNLVHDEEARQRFLREGALVARLSHQNIIKVFDTGVCGDHFYLAMEYLSGGTLKDRMQQGLSLGEKLGIVKALLHALSYAHHKGIVHRDIKPHNILFYEHGIPVLSDFGIAKALDADTSFMTSTNVFIGSPSYMSPEQLRGEAIDHRADLYALGVLFYELLTETLLYPQLTEPFAVALKQVTDPVPELPARFANYQEVLNGLMDKQPDGRFRNAETARRALENAETRDKAGSHTDTRVIPAVSEPRDRPHERRSRSGMGATIAALGLAMLAGGGWYLFSDMFDVEPDQDVMSGPPGLARDTPLPPVAESVPGSPETDAGSIDDRESPAGRDQAIRSLLTRARERSEQGDYQGSLAILDDGLQRWPDAVEISQQRSSVAMDWRDEQRRSAVAGALDRARGHMIRQDYPASLAVLDEALEQWPESGDLRDYRNVVETTQGEHQRLLARQAELERQRLAQERQQQGIAELLDRVAAQGENFGASLDLLEDGLRQWPQAVELKRAREVVEARQAEQQRLETEAEERRQRRVSIAAILRDANEHLGRDEYAASLELLDQGLDRWPDDGELAALRGQVIGRREEYQRQQQARQREQDIERYLQQALQYLQQADYPQSLVTIDEGLELFPDAGALRDLRRAVGEELEAQRRRSEAEQRAAALAERLTECDRHLASDRLTTGVGGNAHDCYLAVLGEDEDNRAALEGLQRIADRYGQLIRYSLEQDDPSRAALYLERMERVMPEHPELPTLASSLEDSRGALEAAEPAGEPESVEAQTHALTVAATPADATIRILNIGPRYRPGMQLPPGRYHLEVTAPGYLGRRRWVALVEDDLRVEIGLTPREAPQPRIVEREPAASSAQRFGDAATGDADERETRAAARSPNRWNIREVRVTGNLASYEKSGIEALFRRHVGAGTVSRSQLVDTAFEVYTSMQVVVELTIETAADGRSALTVAMHRRLGVHDAWLIEQHGRADLNGFLNNSGFSIREI